jgi:hypothetical protein
MHRILKMHSLVSCVAVAVRAITGTFGAYDLNSYNLLYASRNVAFLLSCDDPLGRESTKNNIKPLLFLVMHQYSLRLLIIQQK